MTIYNVNFGAAGTPAITNWNKYTSTLSSTPVAMLDNTDTDNGAKIASTGGAQLDLTSSAWGDSDLHGFPEGVWDSCIYTPNGGTVTLSLTGLPVSASYTLTAIGHTNNSSRDTDMTVGGVTKTLLNEADSASRAAPQSWTGTTSGTGTLDISFTKAAVNGQFYGYCNGFILDVTAGGGRSITNIDTDNDVQAGQSSVTVTTVGLDASPTTKTATLGGESLTVISAGETSWTVDIPLHINLEWGSTTNALVLTDDTGSVTLNNVTLSAPTGWETVTFTSAPDAGTTESFYEYAQTDADVGNFTAAVNDILAFESQSGLTVDSQTIPTVSPPATVSGSYKWWDVSLTTWTSVSNFTITDLGVFANVPAASRDSIWKIGRALQDGGAYSSEGINEVVMEWLVSLGEPRTQLNKMLYDYLDGLGYTGTLNEKMRKWSLDP